MNNIQQLISRYLDGELTNDEITQLASVLQADVASVDRLVFHSFIHSQLLNWMDQQGEQSRDGVPVVDGGELLETIGSTAISSVVAKRDGESLNRAQPFLLRMRRRVFSFGALAAMLLIAASVSIVAYVISSRPVYVGQLTDATACQWGASPTGFGVGTFIEKGQDLNLIQGRAVITFASGAKLLVEGPATLHLNSPTEIRLIDGRIAAKVPRPARGFTVISSLARIVDLGTEFTVALHAEKSFELYVFEGLVELQLDQRFGEAVHQPVRVAEVHAVSFDVRTGDIATLPFQEGKVMPF